MRRKYLRVLTMGMTAAILCTGVAGCGTKTASNSRLISTADSAAPAGSTISGSEASNEHTVTFYDSDGTTVLSTETVEDNATLTENAGEKDGYTFIGWFSTPKLTRKFDFSAPIREDKSVYGGFAKYKEDTRSFAIVGDGKSAVLKASEWGKNIGKEQTLKKEDKEGENVYTITVDLEEGDQFQFAADSNWSDQRGFGYLSSGKQDNKEYLKKEGGLGKTSAQKSNIGVLVSGSYTFTLTTYPDADIYETDDPNYKEDSKENFNVNPFDTITWTYNTESAK